MSANWLRMCIFQLVIADTDLATSNIICGSRFCPRQPDVCSVLQDETIKYQAALRTMDVFAKKHSVQHDIITGHPLVANYIIPPKPESLR